MKTTKMLFLKKVLPLAPLVFWPVPIIIERRIMACSRCLAEGRWFICSDGFYWFILYFLMGLPLAILFSVVWYIRAHRK